MRRRTFLAATVAVAALPRLAFAQAGNPLLAPWTGPFGGVPAFDKVRVADFVPAAERAMADELAEIEVSAANPAPPTFENTIGAMEMTGQAGQRAATIYGSGAAHCPRRRSGRWIASCSPCSRRTETGLSRTPPCSVAWTRSTGPGSPPASRPSKSG